MRPSIINRYRRVFVFLSVTLIVSCSLIDRLEEQTSERFIVVNLGQHQFWDHSRTQQDIAKQLQFSAEDYAPKISNLSDNKSITDEETANVILNQPQELAMTLIRKTVRNKNQHVNGLKFPLSVAQSTLTETQKKLTFEQLKSIQLVASLEPSLSYLPTGFDNAESAPYQADLISQLVAERHYFSLLLYGEFHDNIEQLTPYAEIRFSLKNSSGLQSIDVAKTDILFYASKNYQSSEMRKSQWETQIQGALLTAETKPYSTLENLSKGQALSTGIEKIEELYIESHLKLQHIKITY